MIHFALQTNMTIDGFHAIMEQHGFKTIAHPYDETQDQVYAISTTSHFESNKTLDDFDLDEIVDYLISEGYEVN